jgi:uncharacterized protein (TIGR02391 family)
VFARAAVQCLNPVKKHSIMPRRAVTPPPPIEPREFKSVEEIDAGIAKLERRIRDLKELDIRTSFMENTGAQDVVTSDVRETIREIFGPNSPEFEQHKFIELWDGAIASIYMSDDDMMVSIDRGRTKAIGILNGLIGRLREKREDLGGGTSPAPSTYFDRLKLHPRILDVSKDLFIDGHPWEAVFAAAKALVNYVKERSGCDLDGASLMRTVFSSKNPVLAFNELVTQTDHDEQEGMMHLFEGAVLGIRNPGGHSFPEGPEQRAIEYISLLSLLAYRVQEAKRRKGP